MGMASAIALLQSALLLLTLVQSSTALPRSFQDYAIDAANRAISQALAVTSAGAVSPNAAPGQPEPETFTLPSGLTVSIDPAGPASHQPATTPSPTPTSPLWLTPLVAALPSDTTAPDIFEEKTVPGGMGQIIHLRTSEPLDSSRMRFIIGTFDGNGVEPYGGTCNATNGECWRYITPLATDAYKIVPVTINAPARSDMCSITKPVPQKCGGYLNEFYISYARRPAPPVKSDTPYTFSHLYRGSFRVSVSDPYGNSTVLDLEPTFTE